MHIGLIGGIGPAATELYYRELVRAHPDSAGPLRLTIAHADMATLLRNLAADDRQAQAAVFRRHVEQLAGAGAEVAAVTSVAGHFCTRELEAVSPLPVASALGALAKALERRGLRRIGLLGSRSAMESAVYGAVAGLEIVLPQRDDLTAVGEAYLAMAGAQRASDAQRDLFFRAGAELCTGQLAEAVLLAGTDMFLAFAGSDPGFEVIDSAAIHIDALARLARAGAAPPPSTRY